MFLNKIYKFIFLVVVINAMNSHLYASSYDACPYEGTKIAREELINLTRPVGTQSYVCHAPVESFDIVFKFFVLHVFWNYALVKYFIAITTILADAM